MQIKNFLYEIATETYDSSTKTQDVIDIYILILKLHFKKPFYFYGERIKLYSEQNYVVKFWAPIFEACFEA